MRARTAIAGTAHRVRLTAFGWGLATLLACIALSACTSSPTTPSSSVSLLSPTVSGSVTSTATATATSTATATATSTATATATATVTPSPTPPPTTYYSPYPTAAPVTGGGGTAGFEDAGLAVLGGAAIAAGLGSIAYRRRITRRR